MKKRPDIVVAASLVTWRALCLYLVSCGAAVGILTLPVWSGGLTAFLERDGNPVGWCIAAFAALILLILMIRNLLRMRRHPGAGIWTCKGLLCGVALTKSIPLDAILKVSVGSGLSGVSLVLVLKNGGRKSLPLALLLEEPEDIAATVRRAVREASPLS